MSFIPAVAVTTAIAYIPEVYQAVSPMHTVGLAIARLAISYFLKKVFTRAEHLAYSNWCQLADIGLLIALRSYIGLPAACISFVCINFGGWAGYHIEQLIFPPQKTGSAKAPSS